MTTLADVISAKSPFRHYRFDPAAPLAEHGGGPDAVLQGDATVQSGGLDGFARTTGNTGSRVDLPQSTLFSQVEAAGQSMTFEMLFRTETFDVGETDKLAGIWDNSAARFSLLKNSNDQIVFGVRGSGGNLGLAFWAVTAADYADNAWHDLIARLDSGASISLWFDGVQVASDSVAPMNTWLDSAIDWPLGATYVIGVLHERPLDIDEAALYVAALTDNDIRDHHLGAQGQLLQTPASLAWLKQHFKHVWTGADPGSGVIVPDRGTTRSSHGLAVNQTEPFADRSLLPGLGSVQRYNGVDSHTDTQLSAMPLPFAVVMAFWVEDALTTQFLIGDGDSTLQGSTAVVLDIGQISVFGGGVSSLLGSGVVPGLNVLAVGHDGSDIRTYINGVDQGSTAWQPGVTTNTLRIGLAADGAWPLDGDVAVAALHDGAVSDDVLRDAHRTLRRLPQLDRLPALSPISHMNHL